jgi:hypothetical protein
VQVSTALRTLPQLQPHVSQSSRTHPSKGEPFTLKPQESGSALTTEQSQEIDQAVQTVSQETVQTTFASMIAFLTAYQQTAADLRREAGINSYVDNSGGFNEVSQRASTPVIDQVDANYALSLRYVGRANGSLVATDTRFTDPEMLSQTTQAITAYNLAAQSAKEAQNHATYLQNSMNGLNFIHHAS